MSVPMKARRGLQGQAAACNGVSVRAALGIDVEVKVKSHARAGGNGR